MKLPDRPSRWARARLLAPALALLFGRQPAWAEPIASAEDYRQEQSLVAAISASDSGAALAAVVAVREGSPLASALPAHALDDRLARLLQWIVRDYANSGPLRLLSAAPEGLNGAGRSNTRLQQLQRTYWLQDNALYGSGALLQYAPPLGRILSESWRRAWEEHFPAFCPGTQSDVVVGRLPAYDGKESSGDPRCRLPRPGVWQMFRMRQYPDPAAAEFDTMPTPIIGTDYPGDVSGTHAKIIAIERTSARDLLKYGCLRQVLLGDLATAQQMFDLALEQWDGSGFATAKNRGPDSKLAGVYWTRDLAFAVMCANALGQGNATNWGSKRQVPKALIEHRLWSAQSASGGIWSNYCGDADDSKCAPGATLPGMAKQTNEIAPLVLLAYGRNIWARSH
jgi:hypothetical protein